MLNSLFSFNQIKFGFKSLLQSRNLISVITDSPLCWETVLHGSLMFLHIWWVVVLTALCSRSSFQRHFLEQTTLEGRDSVSRPKGTHASCPLCKIGIPKLRVPLPIMQANARARINHLASLPAPLEHCSSERQYELLVLWLLGLLWALLLHLRPGSRSSASIHKTGISYHPASGVTLSDLSPFLTSSPL